MSEFLKEIGLTKEELQDRIVERAADFVMYNDEDIEHRLYGKLNSKIEEQISTTIDNLAKEHVLPNVAEYVENITLQKTNEWGEKIGKSITFTEYLVEQAHNYMTEQVNYEGKNKAESRGYSFNPKQTRVSYLIEEYLHHSIENAMKEALTDANSAIAEGIEETVKIKLQEIVSGIKATVKVNNR